MKFVVQALLAGWLSLAPAGRGQDADDGTYSGNRNFVMEINQAPGKNASLTVFRLEQGIRTFHWTKPLVSREEVEAKDFYAPSYRYNYRKWLSDDGSVVILRRDDGRRTAQIFFRFIRQDGPDKSYTWWTFMEPLARSLERDLDHVPVGEPLELFAPPSRAMTYAYWEAQFGRWIAVDLGSFALSAPTEEVEKELNALGLAQARDIIRQHQPEAMFRTLALSKEGTQRLQPGLLPKSEPVGAYRFLASQKNPEDKRIIEKLLEYPLAAKNAGGPIEHPDYEIQFSRARTLGDELLAQWEGRERPASEALFDRSKGKPFYLGRLEGAVNLPFLAPEKGGKVHVYLVPDELKSPGWEGNDGVIQTIHGLERTKITLGKPADPIELSRLYFNFDNLTPGKYRLKAIWDKRPPHSDQPPASPGDYESMETAALEVTAGAELPRITLYCTNRVGAAPAYFAADEEWKAEHPAWYQDRKPPSEMRKVLLEAPAREWIVAANEASGHLNFKSIFYVEEKFVGGVPQARRLYVTFTVPQSTSDLGKRGGSRSDENASFTGRLTDAHGCRFFSDDQIKNGELRGIGFSVVPLAAEQFTLEVEDDNGEGKPLVSLVLRNLIKPKSAEIAPREFPLTNELESVTITLEGLDPAREEISAWEQPRANRSGGRGMGSKATDDSETAMEAKFKFSRKGRPAPGWRQHSGIFEDRWGNLSASLNSFCLEEEAFRYRAGFVRDEGLGSFAPAEMFEVSLGKLPGPGESVPINVVREIQSWQFQLFSIGGEGEYTYLGGRLVSATDKIEQVPMPARQPGLRYGPNPKLYIKDERWDPASHSRLDGSWATIVSKGPHLTARFTIPAREIHFGIRERDRSVAEPVNLNHNSFYSLWQVQRALGLEYIPLDFGAGTHAKKLTVIVQKPVVADFAIKIPKNLRRKPGRDSD